ncbi:MAG: ATP-binding protein [Candidatus Zixiibacteriota bacterium]
MTISHLPFQNLAFRTKLAGAVSLVIGGLALGAFLYFPAQSNRRATDALMDKGLAIANMTAFAVAPALYFEDSLAAHELLIGVDQFPDVLEVGVVARSGAVVASHRPVASPARFSPADRPENGDARRISVPVEFAGQNVGTVHLTLSLAQLSTHLSRTRATMGIVCGILFLAGVIAVFVISTWFTRPLRDFVEVTRDIGRGDLSRRATVASGDEIGRLAAAFNGMVAGLEAARSELSQVNRQLEERVRDRTRELQLEVGERRRAEESLEQQRSFLRQIIDTDPSLICVLDDQARFALANKATAQFLGTTVEDLMGLSAERTVKLLSAGEDLVGRAAFLPEVEVTDTHGQQLWMQVMSCPLTGEDGPARQTLIVATDITARKAAESALRNSEIQLRQTHKLEAVGRLAAGIAHEINTPVQFVSDSVNFTREAVADVFRVIGLLNDVARGAVEGRPLPDEAREALSEQERADLPYLTENIPAALSSAMEGLGRIATIVGTMKEFAHPDHRDMIPVDINRAIQSTLTIARNEYKYVADVATDFGDVPLVTCFGGEVNQAILNIVVNAAHAIGAAVKGTDNRGMIRVRTRRDDTDAVIEIQDSGTGIPESVQSRIFDPFFTTKDVGQGTGQGLYLARSIIVDKHKGSIDFVTEEGKGTTFILRLPIEGPKPVAAETVA